MLNIELSIIILNKLYEEIIMKDKILENIKTYILTTIGCIIIAFSMNYFFAANKLAQGGVSGISLMIFYFTKINIGYIYLAINIPLILASYKFLGKDFTLKTLYATLVLTVFLKLFSNMGEPMNDILVASIFGGGLSGIGVGIIFMAGGSSGGIDIIAKIVNKYKGISIAKVMLSLDLLVLSFVAILFEKDIFLYTLISVIVASKMIDIIQEGIYSAKGVTIVTSKSTEIKERIYSDLRRGVTLIQGKGGYTDSDFDIIYCVVGKYQLINLKNLVKEIDKNAFMSISLVHEVIGNGFPKS